MSPEFNPTRSYLAAGALFVDESDAVLLVEPTYKDQHDIPGGMVEPGETPRSACRREIEEELSLVADVGRLLIVDSQSYPTGEDITLFIFDGGTLNARQRSKLQVDGVEIRNFRFVNEADLSTYVPPEFAARLRAALVARRNGEVYDLDHGERTDEGAVPR